MRPLAITPNGRQAGAPPKGHPLTWALIVAAALGATVVLSAPAFGPASAAAFAVGSVLALTGSVSLAWGHGPLVFFVSYSLVLLFQHFAVAVLSGPFVNPDAFTLQTSFKTLFVAGGWMAVFCASLLRMGLRKGDPFPDWLIVAFIAYLGVLFVASAAPVLVRGIYFRNFSNAFLVFLMASTCRVSRAQFRAMLGFHGWLAFVIAIVGIVLYWRHPLTDLFWDSLVSLERFYQQRGYGHMPELDRYAGGYLAGVSRLFPRRAVSIMMDPIAYSCYVGFLLLLMLAGLYSSAILLLPVICFAFLLGGSKAALLFVAVGLIPIARRRYPSVGRLYVPMAVLGAPAALVVAFQARFSTTRIHVLGLLDSLRYLANPTGLGLGSAGNFVSFVADSAAGNEGIAESMVGVLIYQSGLVGLLLFGTAGLGVAYRLYRNALELEGIDRRASATSLACSGAVLGLLAAALFSESALAPRAADWSFMLGGFSLAVGRHIREEGREPASYRASA